MQEYLFSEIVIGLKHSFEVEISKGQMQNFLEMSGDTNPMHLDDGYAKSKGMSGRVVYGLLTSSFYSRLVGLYLPGKFALLHAIEVQFLKPVFIGDKLIVSGAVSSINDGFRQIEVKAAIHNQKLEKISRAKIKVGLLDE